MAPALSRAIVESDAEEKSAQPEAELEVVVTLTPRSATSPVGGSARLVVVDEDMPESAQDVRIVLLERPHVTPRMVASEADAAAFRHYTTVQLVELRLADGAALGAVARTRLLGGPAINYGVSSSPDGRHLLSVSSPTS